MNENKWSRQCGEWQIDGEGNDESCYAEGLPRRGDMGDAGVETKRGIVEFFTSAVSHYSMKTQAATGALTVASIMTRAPLNSLPP